MRIGGTIAAAMFWCAAAAPLSAAPPPYVIDPVFAAPIDRALANVGNWGEQSELARERALGRLNLLAYARDDADFYYTRADERLRLGTPAPCPEPPYPVPPSAPIQPGDLCGGATYDFYMSETPANAPSEPSAGAFARLEAARVHYARAVELDPGDLWVRLGYAYTLDRLGRTNAARAQLRSLLHRGTQNLVGAPVSYEQTAVLQEADARLRHLATSTADRRLLRRMRYRLEHADVIPLPMSPIVVPLIDAPFAALIDTSSPVAWDFTGQGDTRAQGWLGGDAAWLVWDPNQRADIRSGFDMIGQRTWGVFWSDGFEALRALDDNSDGELTGAELGGLSLWRDADGDGVSDAGEVLPASAHGVAALSVRGDATRPGLMTAPAGVRFENGQTRPLYDWTPGLDHAPVS